MMGRWPRGVEAGAPVAWGRGGRTADLGGRRPGSPRPVAPAWGELGRRPGRGRWGDGASAWLGGGGGDGVPARLGGAAACG
uniref:Uncharacterized protein n=1 Tax=Oryza punctata TaxID=4537 RepID=A0A0E0MK44_ORYPU